MQKTVLCPLKTATITKNIHPPTFSGDVRPYKLTVLNILKIGGKKYNNQLVIIHIFKKKVIKI
jgi:hypothetical protein